jgi:hypothetical protein
MFWTVSLLAFVILVGATTSCWSVVAEEQELANIHLQTGGIYDIQDDTTNFTFRLAIGGHDDRFRVRTSLSWDNLTLKRVNETIVLNSSSYGPAFDDFCRLLTDGDNMHVEKWIESDNGNSGTGIGPHDFEQALFGNQTGCVNGVDLQGNYIESIALAIEDFESAAFHPPPDEVATKLNLSLVIRGRPLFPNELDLATVRNLGKLTGYAVYNSTRMYFTAVNGSRWATLEFMIDWNTALVGEQISYVREFGTHNIRELITDGDNGYFLLDFSQFSRSYSESSFFEGQPGCFNGIDLEGNYVQDISLVLEEGSKHEIWETGSVWFSIVPKFVFSGNLGEGPTVCPDCESTYDCDECDDGLPKHTIATTMEILVLLTGWAWFLM